MCYFLHAPTRHISCGDNPEAVYLHGYPLLALGSHHSAHDILEWARGDDDLVATLESTVVAREKEYVGIIDGGKADEAIHLVVGDGEGRVLAVRQQGEMVVVVTEAGVG